MKTDMIPRGVLRLTPCNYGLSKLPFRGPRRPTEGRYVAFLGGSETFGKFIPKPFPDRVETAIGEVCVNLGCQSAGPDAFLHDSTIQLLCHDAAATVIQLPGATSLSNSFYRVHPRRNDRFIAPTDKLIVLYPDIDFTEISFTGHLIARLRALDHDRFSLVRDNLTKTWVRRMKMLVEQAKGPVVLLWLASRAPQDASIGIRPTSHPTFVTREMIEVMRPYVADIIEVVAERGSTEGMQFAPLDALAAEEMLGIVAHEAAAKALRGPIIRALG
jgi:hypothetical protein